ncbi:MAG TPA: response regulator [Methylomirabilota bacterium]|nr:response regulator [Methylomirabilota bacterium]
MSSSATLLRSPSDTGSEHFDEALQRRTLLVVDDEEGPRQSLWAIFQDDYEVLQAGSGREALALARSRHIDAAVLDIRMPDMLGTELLGYLKKIDPAIEVVILTAYQTVETARQALKHGACDYLTKPFDIGAMCAAVSNAMERRSVTEQKAANERLLRELQTEIGNQRLQNEVARNQGQIYASVLHDINNPLTVVSGLIEMMHAQLADATRVEGNDLTKIKARLGQTNRQLFNCIQLSRRYLSFLKPRSSADATVSVNQVLGDLRELLQHHPSLGRNELTIGEMPEDFIASINGIDLIQVLLNLAVNALKATTQSHKVEIYSRVLENGVDIGEVRTSENYRFLPSDTFQNEGALVEITVRDNGPGISALNMGRLFQPYFTTRAPGQGTGLGLSIVQRLVSQAHGAIFFESEEGRGTVFKVYLVGKPAEPTQ